MSKRMAETFPQAVPLLSAPSDNGLLFSSCDFSWTNACGVEYLRIVRQIACRCIIGGDGSLPLLGDLTFSTHSHLQSLPENHMLPI